MTSSASHPTTGKSPSFQFYANDFVSGCARLSTEEVGAYILLICECWDKGSIPGGDMQLLARIAKLTPAKMRRAWFALGPKFHTVDSYNYTQSRLETVRRVQLEFRQRQSDKGKASGASRRATKEQPDTNPGSTPVQPEGQPKGNSPVSGLRSSEEKDRSQSLPTDPKIGERANDFIEFYAGIYPQLRLGVPYRRQDVLDFPMACSLVSTWTDDRRLRMMAEVFLRTEHKFAAEGRRSIRQFAALAELCDNELRRSGK